MTLARHILRLLIAEHGVDAVIRLCREEADAEPEPVRVSDEMREHVAERLRAKGLRVK